MTCDNSVYPPDPSTPVGQVRYLVDDIDEDAYVFTDAQLQAFLVLYKGNIKRAAAQALYVVAQNTALLYKYVKTDDLLVDGVKVAAELRQRAAALDNDGKADDDAAEEFFDIYYPAGGRCKWEYEETAVPHGWWN